MQIDSAGSDLGGPRGTPTSAAPVLRGGLSEMPSQQAPAPALRREYGPPPGPPGMGSLPEEMATGRLPQPQHALYGQQAAPSEFAGDGGRQLPAGRTPASQQGPKQRKKRVGKDGASEREETAVCLRLAHVRASCTRGQTGGGWGEGLRGIRQWGRAERVLLGKKTLVRPSRGREAYHA